MPVRFESRAQWGAKKPKRVSPLRPDQLSGVAIHWFEKPKAAKTHDGCAALLRGVQNTHMGPGGLGEPEGGNDIGYNHAVCPHGKAFTLRGFGVASGANGNRDANKTFAAVVYMAGTGDPAPPREALGVLAEVIRTWQAKGAGPLVKPHQAFVKTGCPGPHLLKWLGKKPPPWAGADTATPIAVEDETPDWLIDFIVWRLGQGGKRALRPAGIPKRIPPSAWEATVRISQLATELGPRETFLDWAEWRRRGAKKDERPPGLPARIPPAWKASFKRLTGELPRKPKPKPKPKVEPPPPPEKPARITPKTTLLAEPRTTFEQLVKFEAGRKHGGYTDANVRGILKKYVTLTTKVGLDPLLVVSQMLEETGHLTSPKSQPPQRNPAGIGASGGEVEGASFATWDKAIRAHVGRLLAYALPEGKGTTPTQRALIKEALEVRELPPDRLGCAPVLAGLTKKWAMDPQYARKIAAIANQIRPL